MKGNIKIQLFDAETGTLVKEQNEENFVAKGLEEKLRFVMRGFLLQGKKSMSTDQRDTPFQDIFLTDSGHAEDPENEWVAKGEITAFGSFESKPTALNESIYGTLVASETEVTAEKIKVVVEFLTSKGNGTHKSIYSRPRQEPDGNIQTFSKKGDGKIIGELDGFRYILKGTTLEKRNSKGSLIDEMKNITSVTNIFMSDGYLYGNYYNSEYYYFLNLSDFGAGSFRKVDTPGTYISAVLKKGVNYYAVDNGKRLWKSTAENFSDKVLVKNLPFDVDYEQTDFIDGVFFTNSFSDKLINGVDLDGNLCSVNKRNYSYKAAEDPNYIFLNYVNSFYKIPKYNISSRALLSEPITKTDKQTMKITYEFTLPPF